MQLKIHTYTTTTCAVEVPQELLTCIETVPKELRSRAVDEYARLKDGLEVTSDQMSELFLPDNLKELPVAWQDFLYVVVKLHPVNKVDVYMFCV